MSGQNYNPLDKQNLGASVAQALLEQGELALSSLERFHGAGVYAIYLAADSDLYSGYSASPADGVRRPIYVGKAVPAGARKGGYGLDFPTSNALYKRIADHRKSIGQANNLTVADFSCKYLVTDDIWIALAEAVLISQFMPVWNVEIDGFGIHAPGKGRKRQKKSAWDTLHLAAHSPSSSRRVRKQKP